MINLNDAGAKKGALDALSLLLASRQGPIRVKQGEDRPKQDLPMPKNVQIQDVTPEDPPEQPEGPEEKPKGAEKLDPKEIAQELKNIKDEIDKRNKSHAEQKAAEQRAADQKQKEKDAKLVAAGKKLNNFSNFEEDMQEAIFSQLGESANEYATFNKINGRYADTQFIMPTYENDVQLEHPIINVYFDLSGSISANVIQQAKNDLSFLTELQNDDKLDYETYWFASKVSKDPNDVGSGTRAFPKILDHVRQTGADNVIIFTDDDFDRQSGYIPDLPYVKVDGCVWWMWASKGKMAKKAWPHLTSYNPLGVFHYDLRY